MAIPQRKPMQRPAQPQSPARPAAGATGGPARPAGGPVRQAPGKPTARSSMRALFSKDDMRAAVEDSAARKDDSGKYGTIFKANPNVKFWKCKAEGDHILDIVPFIAGSNHPHVKEGKPTHILDLHIHRKIGVNEDTAICMSRTYKKRCVICEWLLQEKEKEGWRKEDTQDYEPKRRAIYNVRVYDTQADSEIVQIWDSAHFLTEAMFIALAKNPRGGGHIAYAHPDDGKTIAFTKQGSSINTKYVGIRFLDREELLPDEFLEMAHPLDQLIEFPDQDELARKFFNMGDDDQGGDVAEGMEEGGAGNGPDFGYSDEAVPGEFPGNEEDPGDLAGSAEEIGEEEIGEEGIDTEGYEGEEIGEESIEEDPIEEEPPPPPPTAFTRRRKAA